MDRSLHKAMGNTAWKPSETLVELSIKLKTYMLPEHKLVELQQATKDDTVLQELEKAVKTVWPAMSTRNEVLKPNCRVII